MSHVCREDKFGCMLLILLRLLFGFIRKEMNLMFKEDKFLFSVNDDDWRE